MEMDRPSVAFAKFLDSIVIESTDDNERQDSLLMSCSECGGTICFVDDGDTLRVLLNTALAHDCTG